MRSTIKNHKDFAMGDTAPTAKTSLFIVRARPTLFPGDARYGLVATKKTFKLAVHRNRAKRCLRVWIRENESSLNPDMDHVFIARNPILNATKDEGIAATAKALRYLNKIDA
ncbi:MAG: ribonuclease P protein component [Rickettsiales bacterium]|jgi:ribonuclease P protein component|nr:ribonuclease P protein component [Rickettsiales bacterium]